MGGSDRTQYRVPGSPTAFEQRVYAIVRRIPRGEVRSYQWVARKLGNRKLARAVGQALRRNPWPVRVPCHRVVRADGSLGGYAWGQAAKRRLLKQEQMRCRPKKPGILHTVAKRPIASSQAGGFFSWNL